LCFWKDRFRLLPHSIIWSRNFSFPSSELTWVPKLLCVLG
jgi:hypothetical protein